MSQLIDFLSEDATLYQDSSNNLVQYRDRASNLATEYKVPSKYIDDLALNKVSAANSIKQNIVSVGGNVGLSSACYLSTTTFITSTYGSMVVSTGIATASTLGVVGLGTTAMIAYGVIKYDSLQAYNYPRVENADASVNNPFDGEGYVNVNSGNSGIGKNTVYLQNGGSNVGYVFSVSTGGGCPGSSIANSVSNLISQYNNEVTGITSYTNDATVVKTYKTEYQFHVWSYNRKIQENTDSITSDSALSQILNNPSYGGPY